MYTDPGLVSMAVAAVAGAIMAVPMFLVIFRKKVRSWFDRRKKQL